ncbi:MAG: AAA family ATPase [Burkholderiaceae bacterium]|nr:AAA family ATPase [Burkholderiaceae bacterium]
MENDGTQHDIKRQALLVAALKNSRHYPYPAKTVRLFETHISWVLLAGRYAYKIKKSLDMGFLDFTTLAKREFFCAEEIRLNRRLAPQIYLDVVSIGGSVDEPVIGREPAIEYAVRMRRFSVENEMDRLMRRGAVQPQHIDSLAQVLAQFHLGLPPMRPDSPYGTAEIVREMARQNFTQLPPDVAGLLGHGALSALRAATENEFVRCQRLIDIRRQQGFVRECHGDLHLGNLLIRGGQAVPFDGIEFSPELRWIDIIDDIAFPLMDLQYFGRPDFAWRLLNGWLENTGDYDGLALLRWYASYRAAVRGKVGAIRSAQASLEAGQRTAALETSRTYFNLAAQLLQKPQARLIITHGLPGSGKTTFAQAALETLGAIRIRSDVERKRLFGLAPLERSQSSVGGDMYGAEATRRTYDRLLDLARSLLAESFPVIVDAAFLRHDERVQFRRLAEELGVPFFIASIQACENVLRARIEQRQRTARDASEADVAVLAALQVAQQPLQDDERGVTVTFVNDGQQAAFGAGNAGWNRLKSTK